MNKLNHIELNNAITQEVDGFYNLAKDREALAAYLEEVGTKTRRFPSELERLSWLVQEDFYFDIFALYDEKFLVEITEKAYTYGFKFASYMAATKFYKDYALKTNDKSEYLENYEQHMVIVALYLAQGDNYFALELLDALMKQIYQPATPTMLNAGRSRRGELVSCFPAGTPVMLKGNITKPIEDVAVGDLVLTHTGEYKRVYETIQNPNTTPMVKVRIAGRLDTVMTENHPVLVYSDEVNPDVKTLTHEGLPDENFRWIQAKDIKPGQDYVVDGATTAPVLFPVVEVLPSEDVDVVYNLEVEDNHSYSVNGFYVHNCYLLTLDDSLNSINYNEAVARTLSKNGGGVALNLSKLRARGETIKDVENCAKGVVPVAKSLEMSFQYADQLG